MDHHCSNLENIYIEISRYSKGIIFFYTRSPCPLVMFSSDVSRVPRLDHVRPRGRLAPRPSAAAAAPRLASPRPTEAPAAAERPRGVRA